MLCKLALFRIYFPDYGYEKLTLRRLPRVFFLQSVPEFRVFRLA